MNYKEVKKEFFFYKRGTAGGFQTALFDLFGKADVFNKERLGQGFPNHLQVIKDWINSPTEEEFFKEYTESEK